MKIQNVPRNIPRYVRRFYYYRQNSAPFLSGDLFADSADVQLYPPRFRTKQATRKVVSRADVIFCPSHFYERMLEEYSGVINAKVLILGNSDRDFEFLDTQLLPRTVKQVFVQNLSTFDPRTSVLPIGIENTRLGTNGNIKYFRDELVENSKLNRVLVGPFSMTHVEREFYSDAGIDDSDLLEVLRGRVNPEIYAGIASGYKFIAAPRGNGLDTHRFWEALYRGSFPVVLKNSWSKLIQDLGVPLVEIESWTVEGFRKLPSNQEQFNPGAINALWWPYWQNQIKSYL